MNLDTEIHTHGLGSRLGYMTCSKSIIESLRRLGVVIDNKAKTRLDFRPIFYAIRKRFKFNALFTMWEFDDIPEEFHYRMDLMDLLIVPCEHNKELYSKYTSTPVEVCPLGVNTEYYQYHERETGDKFIFLYVGDNNPRKGIFHIIKAWERWNKEYEQSKNCVLIMKVTEHGAKQELTQVASNVYKDTRVLPFYPNKHEQTTIRQVYNYANCFLMPSMGEGFGLSLAEAMATGLPCIYTPWSGPVDFLSDETGYPVEYDFKPFAIKRTDGKQIGEANYANPKIDSILKQMEHVYNNYFEALGKGRKASERIQKYTWMNTGKTLLDILTRCAA